MRIQPEEILLLYFLIILFAAPGKSYRDLFDFRKADLKLPHWGKLGTKDSTDDSWHYGDGYNDAVSLFVPFAYLMVRTCGYSWYWSLLVIACCFVWYWMEYYQTFLWCYHYFFNKVDERYRIYQGYKNFFNSLLFWRKKNG